VSFLSRQKAETESAAAVSAVANPRLLRISDYAWALPLSPILSFDNTNGAVIIRYYHDM